MTGWVIYNSKGLPLVTQEQHDHTTADDSGPMTDDEHDGYSQYDEIALPDAPDVGKGRMFVPDLNENDSIGPGPDKSGLLYRHNKYGQMTEISSDFQFSRKTHYIGEGDVGGFLNSWVNYTGEARKASYSEDMLGCVWVSGLIASGTINQNAFWMPEHLWPTGYRRWATSGNSAQATVDWNPVDKCVHPETGANGYFELGIMHWPREDRINWHEVDALGEPAFEGTWANYGGSWDTAAFAKDALGRVWIKGLVKSGGDATTVFTLPLGYRPDGVMKLQGASAGGGLIAAMNIYDTGEVEYDLIGAGTNSWATIMCMFPADGAGDWHEVGDPGEPPFLNAWVNVGGGWVTAAFYKDAAGIVHIKGFIKNGAIGQDVFKLPEGYRPGRSLNLGTISLNQGHRFQVAHDGDVQAVTGINGWYTLHASFPAEQ